MSNIGLVRRNSHPIHFSYLKKYELNNSKIFELFNFVDPTCDSKTDYEEEPLLIHKTYTIDLNLLCIHNIIRAKFIHEKKKSPLIKKEMELMELSINSSLSPIDIQSITKKINILKEQYERILYGNLWGKYKISVIPILNNYITVMSNKSKGIYTIGKEDNDDEEIIFKRLEYIDQYIQVIKKLNIIELDLLYLKDTSLKCPICNNKISNNEMNQDGLYICSCGYTIESLYSTSEYNDINKPISINTNESIAAFHKWLNHYMGISGDIIDENLFLIFDEWCIKNNYPTGKDIIDGKYPKTFIPNQKLLIRIMYDTKNSKYYSNKNIIRHLYWGWKLPILDQNIINQAVNRYVITQKIYQDIKTRVSKINMELLGYLILHSLGHNCFLDDFKIPISIETIKYTNEIWCIICEKADIKYEKIII